MQKTQYIWQNGDYKSWDDATVHVLAHTLHYGGGAFEGIRIYDTKLGPAIFRLSEHIDRLFYSAKALGMKIPYAKDDIIAIIVKLVKLNHLSCGYIRPIVYFGCGGLSVYPNGNPVELVIACWPPEDSLPSVGVDIKTSRYIRIHPQSTVPDAKLCGQYLNGILASIELQGTHYHEALLLDANGNIAEGAEKNFFIVKHGQVYTPELGSILPGITRDTIMELASHCDFSIVEQPLTLQAAYKADEAFFAGTAAAVTTIRSIDDNIIGNGEVGAVTKAINQAFQQMTCGNDDTFIDYLTVV